MTTALFENEGAAKVCAMQLIGRGAQFTCDPFEGTWAITVPQEHADVFRQYNCELIPAGATASVRKVTPPPVAAPSAPAWGTLPAPAAVKNPFAPKG